MVHADTVGRFCVRRGVVSAQKEESALSICEYRSSEQLEKEGPLGLCAPGMPPGAFSMSVVFWLFTPGKAFVGRMSDMRGSCAACVRSTVSTRGGGSLVGITFMRSARSL